MLYVCTTELIPKDAHLILEEILKTIPLMPMDDHLVNEMRPLLYQGGVITSEEATELLGIFTGEEKIIRLYNEILPKKGQKGLKKFMDILCDTGWDTPSHLQHHAVLLTKLSVSKPHKAISK